MRIHKLDIVHYLGLLLLFCLPTAVFAEETNASDSGETTGFYYEVVQPENQLDKDVGYFDLKMTPGQKQTVHIDFINTGTTEIILDLDLNGAKTNQNGVIEYGPTVLENDPSLKYDFIDLVSTSDEIVLPAGQTTPLALEIEMPNESFDGIVAGGIRFAVKDDEGQEMDGIVQKTAYMIGMLLRVTDAVVEPELELNSVYPELNNYRGSIYASFSNVRATFIGDLTVEATIAKASNPEDILYDSKTSGMSMAPNSYITYPISLNGTAYEADDYVAEIDVTSGGNEWHWTKEFTITKEQADEFNEQDVSLVQEKGFNWQMIAMVAGGVITLILIVYVIVRSLGKKKRKRKKRKK